MQVLISLITLHLFGVEGFEFAPISTRSLSKALKALNVIPLAH